MIVTIGDNEDYIQADEGPVIILSYHYYRVGGLPNLKRRPKERNHRP